MTCFMSSPSVAGLLSLPAVERSTEGSVKLSVTIFCIATAGLIRGADVPHAEVACFA